MSGLLMPQPRRFRLTKSIGASSLPPLLTSPPRTGRLSPLMVGWALQVIDAVMLLQASLVAYVCTYGLHVFDPVGFGLVNLIAVVSASAIGRHGGVYDISSLRSFREQARLLAKPVFLATVLATAGLFFLGHDTAGDRVWPFTWSAAAYGGQLLLRPSFKLQLLRWTRGKRLVRRVAVLGVGTISEELIARLQAEPGSYSLVGLYDDRMSRIPSMQAGVPVLGTVGDLLERTRTELLDVIVITLPLSARTRILGILQQLESTLSDVCIATDIGGFHVKDHQRVRLASSPVAVLAERPLKGWDFAKKMIFDRVIGVLLLLAIWPFLILIALAIRWDSPGPILFRQPRIGFNNKLFSCYKFRTMRQDMTDLLADQQTVRNDPRVTRLGRFLRKTSLDELPQLFNVVLGNMSLVGPRPHAPNTKAAELLFTEIVARYASRHRVKPGITGWAQINGWRGQTQTLEQIEKRVEFDLHYIENWSILFDLKIMILTVLREFRNKDAF